MLNKKFVRNILTNILITMTLIPISILFTKLISVFKSDIWWYVIGTIGLIAISYAMYKNEERG